MSDVRAHAGVPVIAQFGGTMTPSACAPLVVDSATGIIYSVKTGDVVVAAGAGGTVTSIAQTFTGGLIAVAGSPVTASGTLALTVAGTSGGVPYFSSGTTWASSAALAANALVIGGGAGAAPSTVTTGANVLTALGVAVGSAGAFVTFNGAGGTPSTLTGTNISGTAASLTAGTVTTNATLTGPVTSVGNATTIVAPTYPLMDYGGKKFDGSTDYLDTNALTGIVDSKKGSVVIIARFANAASAIENIISNTGTTFFVTRIATGDFRVFAKNSAGTTIMDIRTTGTPAAAAGTYVLMASWDLASAGSGKIYVNDVSSYSEVTFINDTMDLTVTEYSVGATVAGANFFTGDMYLVWLTGLTNRNWTTESVRRTFIDSNLTPVFLGANGELPFGTSPILFLGYDTVARWKNNRGTATSTFTENGTPAEVTTELDGQYAPLSGVYTPALTNVANLTSTAYACQYIRSSSQTGGNVTVSGRVDVDPTLAATSTQLGISLPFASALTAAEQCAGTAFASGIAGQGAAILGDATNDRAQMQWISTDLTNQAMYFTFTYRII